VAAPASKDREQGRVLAAVAGRGRELGICEHRAEAGKLAVASSPQALGGAMAEDRHQRSVARQDSIVDHDRALGDRLALGSPFGEDLIDALRAAGQALEMT
jgi:hypothetical protein